VPPFEPKYTRAHAHQNRDAQGPKRVAHRLRDAQPQFREQLAQWDMASSDAPAHTIIRSSSQNAPLWNSAAGAFPALLHQHGERHLHKKNMFPRGTSAQSAVTHGQLESPIVVK
jgi:hypothetical protein